MAVKEQKRMKEKATCYLENSVISMYFDETALYLRDMTRLFWQEVLPDLEVFISEMVLREIGQISNQYLREVTLRLIADFDILEEVSEIREISDLYLSVRRLPRGDAMHLAFASFYGMDFLVTWNLRHLYKPGTQEMIREVNTQLRIPVPVIVTPENFLKEEE